MRAPWGLSEPGVSLTPERLKATALRILPAALLLLMLVLAGGSAMRESVTVDEVAHIGAAVSYIQRLDMRLNGEHPPLSKVLAGVPLALRGVYADYSSAPWARAGDRHMAQWIFGEWVLNRWNDPRGTLLWARAPMLALTLALGWAVFVIGRRLGGVWGGLLSLTAYVTTPTFLAFGPLVVTDLAVTMFTLLGLWTFANLWQAPDRKRIGQFGAALACAVMSKFTAGILFLAFLCFAVSARWWPLAGLELKERRIRWRAAAQGVLLAASIVYAVYFVLSWNQPTQELDYLGDGPAAMVARRLLMPVWLCLRGVLALLSGASRPTFLLGQKFPHGVWFYFPVLFALKSTPGFLGLLLLTAILAVLKWHRAAAAGIHWRVLGVGFIVFTAFCLLSRVNIGLRHFGVPMILLIVGISALPALIGDSRLAGALAALCAASCLLSAIYAYPFYIPYVNVLTFGRPAYELMGDANVDWHQALPEVRSFADRHNLASIRLDDFGMSDPSVVVPQAMPWNCEQPSSNDAGQWAVVSANMIVDFRSCAWLTHANLEPLGGGSLYAVRLPDPIPQVASNPSAGHGYTPRALYREAVRHPERTPQLLDELEARTNPPKPAAVR